MALDLAGEWGGAPARLDPDLEATVYRLVQETVNNEIKHAAPGRISITVSCSEATLEVIVVDDGSGFAPESIERSFGLVGMEERVSLAGGRLEIDSEPGRGTEVHATLPLFSPSTHPR
jgi:two-component system, NarL family, sensor histidine kinase UhpB